MARRLLSSGSFKTGVARIAAIEFRKTPVHQFRVGVQEYGERVHASLNGVQHTGQVVAGSAAGISQQVDASGEFGGADIRPDDVIQWSDAPPGRWTVETGAVLQKPRERDGISLMRRHRHNLKPEQKIRLLAYLGERPALNVIYRFKQRLCYLLLK